ncbi:MAG: hypothetical protein LBD58_12735 [Treponema sp.]|nr:hypothetical protein [Treponema sp.]
MEGTKVKTATSNVAAVTVTGASGDKPDGSLKWNAIGSRINSDAIYGVAYGGGRFVAVGAEGEMSWSTDGVAWTAVTDSGVFGESVIRGVAYGGDKFVAVGGTRKAGDSNKMAWSTDGITWTAVSNSTFGAYGINGATYGGDKFVVVGDKGKMRILRTEETVPR